MKRATMQDVADAAGVGVATVDRVLNARARVSPATARLVLKAAESLDYHAAGLLRHRVEFAKAGRRFGFVLQKQAKWFYRFLDAELRAACMSLHDMRVEAEVAYVEALSPAELAASIRTLGGQVDVLAIVSIDHPLVHDAVQDVTDNGVPVFALLSQVSSPAVTGYVGIDGRKAGRTAGWFMARTVHGPGEIGLLIGSHRYLGQEDREAGFRGYMRAHATDLRVRDSTVYLDDAAVAYEAVSALLSVSPDLKGIYHCGGGVRGAIAALAEADTKLAYVCHEASPPALDALRHGLIDLVIETPVHALASRAVSEMKDTLLDRKTFPPKVPIDFRLITPENI